MLQVRVISQKYDGALRDEYTADFVSESAESIVLLAAPGLVCYDHRRGAWSAAPDGLLEIYFKRRWYNVWHIAEQVSGTNRMYVNIAQPATLTDNTLRWTDLDLDYRVHLDGRIERLDQAEFDENTVRLGYPPDLLEHVHTACRQVEAGLAGQAFPFDHDRQVALYRRIKS